MKVTVLNENTAGKRGFLAEHGLSLLIETEHGRWLFDAGQRDVFLKNAECLGETLLELDGIILSHGHFDHCGGLEYLARAYREAGRKLPPVYVREAAFRDKTAINSDGCTYRIIGIPWKRELLGSCIRLTSECQPLAEGVWVLGNIPYTEGLEEKPSIFFIDDGEKKIPDYMEDEQMLVFETGRGLCLFAGCCHPGILNCLQYVKNKFPDRTIYSVFAGMHLSAASGEQIRKTAEALEKSEIERLFPVHCTGIEAIGLMKQRLGRRCTIVETGKQFTL